MTPMTKLQVIENAVAHLLKQGRFAFRKTKWNSRPVCIYDGTSKCAIGGLPGVSEAIKGFKHSNKVASYLYQDCHKFRALFADEVGPFFLDKVQRELHDEFCQTANATRKITPEIAQQIKDRAEALKRNST